MFDWVLNTPLNTIKKNFPGVSKIKLMTFSIFFQRLTFPANTCQRLRRIENPVKHSTMELFREIFFSPKFTRKNLCWSLILIKYKVAGLCTTILLKERTPTQVNFARYFLQNTSRWLLLFCGKNILSTK